jgi:selenophosphate synthase
VQDEVCLLEAELMLSKNKFITLESSNKQVHEELAKLREELKSALAAKQTAKTALVAKETEQKKQLLTTKQLNDNLTAIGNSVNEFAADVFGKSFQLILFTCLSQMHTDVSQ